MKLIKEIRIKMNKETIEKAAREYAEENPWYPGETYYESDIREMEEHFADTYIDGAQWRINSVWHNTCDIAEPGKDCLVEYMGGDGNVGIRIDRRSEYEWANACHYDKILRWAYVSDLLPDRKETNND